MNEERGMNKAYMLKNGDCFKSYASYVPEPVGCVSGSTACVPGSVSYVPESASYVSGSAACVSGAWRENHRVLNYE